jgi:hypothetical protein
MSILHKALVGGTLLLALGACGGQSETPVVSDSLSDPEVLQARLTALTRNVEAAEAVRSVKRLQWAYGHYSELGLWHDFADLFADTGVGHYTQGDLDREQIRALFLDQVGQGRLGLAEGRIYPHISFSPVVTLDEDGSQAKGRFRILAMLGGYGGNATWFHGLYENVYVREEGVWKLNELSNTAQVTGNFTAGLSPPANRPLDVVTFAPHFLAEQVGRVAPTAQDVADELTSLQQRLQRLADESAVINLQHQLGFHLDRHEWDAVAALFAEQGTFETDQRGVYVGKASIRNALNQFNALESGDVDEHILFQTYVSVAPDGRGARARVDQLGLQGAQGESAQWTQGIHENTFIKEEGEWRIQSLHYYPRLITDYGKGWGADAQAAPGTNAEYPPDAPPTESFEAYPAFYLPAFHFAHPVTGRPPQYPEGDPARGKAPGFANTQPQTNAASATDSTDLQAQLVAMEVLAQQALAYDAVENLVNAYAYYLDECMPEYAAQLFAADGESGIPGIGFYRGPERIAQALRLAYCPAGRQADALTLHHAVQPVIAVSADGRSATVLARLWQVHASADPNDYYVSGLLHGKAVMEDGQWKLVALDTEYKQAFSATKDWTQPAADQVVGYAPSEQMRTGFPPDR